MKRMIVGLALCLGACGAPSGPVVGATVTGNVSSTQGGGIGSATVTITPGGAAALAGAQTTTSGDFEVDNVPTGDGNLTVSGLPGNCEPTVSLSYTGLKNGGHRILNIVVPCS